MSTAYGQGKDGMKMQTWTLINYFDVWGNAQDGYEVNNQCAEAEDIIITDGATNKDILNFLVSIHFLRTSDMRRIAVENMGDWIEIYERKGMMPICGLHPNRL